MKTKYLNDLKEYLEDKNVVQIEVDEIINDYSEFYDQALESGLTDEEVIKKLGNKRDVYNALKDDLTRLKVVEGKVVGLMVFISLILFFVVGQAFGMWAYSWMFFFLIPMSAVLTSNKGRSRLPAISVFLSIILFIILGLVFSLWHPGWLVFLLIPVSGIMTSYEKNKITPLSPFIALTFYFIIAKINTDYYLYAWPIFLIIPLAAAFDVKNKTHKVLLILSLLISIAAYYSISLSTYNWAWPLLVFALPIASGVFTRNIKVVIEIDSILDGVIYAIILIVYLVVSLITSGWTWSWMILLLLPMYGIYSTNKFNNITAYMPFVSVILFYTFGIVFDGGFVYSWLFFLLIPMVGIMFPGKDEDEDLDDSE